MESNPTRSLWLSVGLAILAMFLVYSYSQEKKAEYDKKYGATKNVVIASQDILEMSTVVDTMLQTIEVPAEFVQPGAVENPEEAIDWVATTPIKKGEQVLLTKLVKPGPRTGLAHQVSPTKRAVTIGVDEVRGVAKLVRPGDRIDILTVISKGGGVQRQNEVKTLLQDVVVLATGQRITNNIPRSLEATGASAQYVNLSDDTSFRTLTLELNPKEAQDLIYIMSTSPGSIYLTLRNPNDRKKDRLGPTTSTSVSSSPNMGQVPRIPANVRPKISAPAPRAKAPPKRKPSGPFVEIK